MVKSTRSKWKKMHRRERAKDEAPQVAVRLQRLNVKLGLCANGGLSQVPVQDPETRFHFKQPERKAGERLVLGGMKTNPRGKSNPDAPHPVTFTYDKVDPIAPTAGMAITKEDEARIESFHAAAADALANPDYDNEEPVEFILGCNDDEGQTTVVGRGKSALAGKKAAPLNSKKEVSVTATKLKSMEIQKGITKGDKKIKFSDAPNKRLVSGGKKK
jgi:hypothetical protein